MLLVIRLFTWQIIRGKELSAKARNQHEIGLVVQAPRGSILANDGTWLAARGEAWLVYASLPDIEEDAQRIADKIAPFFLPEDTDEQTLLSEVVRITSLLQRDDVVWVPLKHKVDSETKSNIEALEIKGVGFEPQEARVYPESSAAAHTLGFVGKSEHGEDVGYFGLEGFYDLVLSGKPGYLARESDAQGSPILFGSSREVFAVEGVDLMTHIDKAMQLKLEKRLSEGMETYGASGATGIIMDPRTGAIMAMASFPSYDPDTYSEWSDELFKNPAVSDSFEPGSIFKVLVMAAALDSGEVEKDTKCDICTGPVKVDKYHINTWNNEYFPDSTMTEVIIHSDNVGMVFAANKLGADRLYDYLDKFGIGRLTGIDLQGEATPGLREKGTWSVVDLATASFGQGVAITPIQITRAVAAIANDGVLVTPQVVDRLVGDGWEEDIEPVLGKRVLSVEAANDITAMMAEAAKLGRIGKRADSQGFKIAGKSGTAQIPIQGHYDEGRTIASYVGFAPYDDPQFVMLMTLREPTTSQWAAETTAPVWYGMAEDLFLHLGIQTGK